MAGYYGHAPYGYGPLLRASYIHPVTLHFLQFRSQLSELLIHCRHLTRVWSERVGHPPCLWWRYITPTCFHHRCILLVSMHTVQSCRNCTLRNLRRLSCGGLSCGRLVWSRWRFIKWDCSGPFFLFFPLISHPNVSYNCGN